MAARYRIEKEIGRGAMGRVYLAHDTLLERDVALKELVAPHYLTDEEKEEVRERFRLEAKAAARLTHPHILTVHDIISSGDRQFIVMEYLEGKTLREVLATRVLSPEEVMSIAPMVSDALDYAHSHGIIHRDVKPDNIFVLENGNIKVADFGIAKMLKVSDRTHTDVIMGTPNYIAPELVKGQEYDHRVDIFSLGVTLYELLTGKRPFEAENDYAIIYKVASEDPEPLGELRDDLPQDLVAVVQRALEKDPGRRYPDMKRLKEDLMKVRAGLGMSVTREEKESFSKEEALRSALEAAKGMSEAEPAEAAKGEVPDFRRDKEWKELIARVYQKEPEEADPVLAAEKKARWEEMEERAKRRQAYAAAAQADAESALAASKQQGLKAAAQGFLTGTLSPHRVLRLSGFFVGAGLLLIASAVLPWIGSGLRSGNSLFGVTFPEGMAVVALTCLALAFDVLLLLDVGSPRRWTRAMSSLTFMAILAVLLFFVLRVILGLGYEKLPSLDFLDHLRGVGYGLWMSLVFAVAACWASRRIEEAV